MTKVSFLAAVLLAVAGGSLEAARAQDAPAGDAANGKAVYLKVNCFQCHGRAGQGGAMNYPAPPLAKTPMPFEGFKMVVRESMRDMPAYVEAVLSDKELIDIYAFLQTLSARRSPKDIVILND
jgi:mono/diheme cytochrome c family protein